MNGTITDYKWLAIIVCSLIGAGALAYTTYQEAVLDEHVDNAKAKVKAKIVFYGAAFFAPFAAAVMVGFTEATIPYFKNNFPFILGIAFGSGAGGSGIIKKFMTFMESKALPKNEGEKEKQL